MRSFISSITPAIPVRWLLLITGAIPLALLVACGDDDEPPTSSPTAAASASAPVPPSSTALGPGGGGEPPGGATVEHPTPLPTVTAVPAGWATFTQEETSLTAAFTFRYPKGWFVDAHTGGPPGEPDIGLGVIITPWDPTHAPVSAHPGSLKVDLVVGPPEQGCGIGVRRSDSSLLLGGLSAQRLVVDYPDEDGELVRAETVWFELDGRQYCIAGFHYGPLETEETFATILHSFEFTK